MLCLVPWHVTLVNGGHECAVVEASSPADPLSPPPIDPDVLDAPGYRQIAQRNLSVLIVAGTIRDELLVTVCAGARADKTAVIEVADEQAARRWAGKLAEACGWPQEVRRFKS